MKGRKTGGRKKGSTNKLTANAKQAFEFAFQEIGGAPKLAEWALENSGDFYKLFARLIPIEHNGADDGPIQIAVGTPAEFKKVAEEVAAKV